MIACTLAFAVAACSRPPPNGDARVSGLMLDSQLSEISGLAVSNRHDDTLWMHDDGGNPPRLFAVDRDGGRVATFRIEGVPKTDWEDIAAFRSKGRDWLMLADTGDNGGLRRTLQLHVVEEPATLENARLKPAWSIVFRWPDGPRDCEAVAVDERRGEVLLISKRRQPPELFRLPLTPQVDPPAVAERIARLRMPPALAPQSGTDERAPLSAQVTAASISPNGQRLAVLTYRYLLIYAKQPDEDWARAVARPPRILTLPWLPQAEAMGWDRDGRHVFATGEFVPAPLYRIDVDADADERR
ncbi:hypothetical protein [Cognatilysobacter terrigena]|uniref:hypothetical protein n=1 Tax=Cognatilysobacter terrigena TaxID=2488749 RepID=UPI001414DE4C|nr:hypothetical protein [Lysobacter terrigena]